MLHEIVGQYELTAQELRNLAVSDEVHQASRVELARQRLMDSVRTLGMMAEQQQMQVLRNEEHHIRDRLDHETEYDLLANTTGLLTSVCPDSSCGLLLTDPDTVCSLA
jgi:hypothetical protein